MKTGFKDPIESKMPKNTKKSPFDFRQPPYDERSSCYINAGSHYGVGNKQPVGHEGNPQQKVAVLPFGRVKTIQVADVPVRNYPLDNQE
jgi:hypothetical protein